MVQAKKAKAEESVADCSAQLSTDHGSTHLKIVDVAHSHTHMLGAPLGSGKEAWDQKCKNGALKYQVGR